MKAAFHYLVKIKLFNYHNKDRIEFIDQSKEFYNDDPIIAREEAFRVYQNWLDIFLEGIGMEYSTDRQAREDMQLYIVHRKDLNLSFEENKFNLSNTHTVGIGVFFVIDTPSTSIYKDDNLNDHKGDEDLIHGIGNSGVFNDPSNFAFNLQNEFEYYENNNYNFKNYYKKATCYKWIIEDVDEFEFLETPFDWTGMDNPANPLLGLQLVETSEIEDIIAQGEGEQVEFKPTLSYHFTNKSWKGKYEVNYKNSKAICAFLNSLGGTLLIGLKDNGTISGLDFDFSLTQKENKIDFIKNELDTLIDNFIGFENKPLINADFINFQGKLILRIIIQPSKKDPVFLQAENGDKEFWVRGNASNRRIHDKEKIMIYWINRKISDNPD